MKIIAILSSPHGKKSATLGLVEAAMEGARQAGADTELIDITKLKINYCKGCITCYAKGRCPQQDDFQAVLDRMLAADGIILSSPNYIDNVTGQLKTLLDRMADVIHAQLFDGKYGFSITTSGGGNDDFILQIMNSFLTKSGANAIGGVGIAVGKDYALLPQKKEEAKRLGAELVSAIREKKRYPDQDALHEDFRKRFAISVKYNKDRWASDYARWVSKGWLKE
ncbi:flavodoxin family protein [Methanocella arvoryzae]|uniref:4Fe-4S ferredoxin-domain protein (NADPH-dependent FMN reductase family) n=1 Tax=Methanocella arvoryzae (strain DSM 22066 / NBRC 105507 / MRE50) TaxID=351160 RepID=Q0W890_METAR|nr:flavodoxin family protein [Methanocella arvoryzae]CAJ35403.1 4Fe-4S ferredoxin-domain protein (NADPH-dependent FMN reductase family) [Methanocella arvoryzae MRE50]